MCNQKLFLTTDSLLTKNGILQFKAWLFRLGRCKVKPKLPRTEWLVFPLMANFDFSSCFPWKASSVLFLLDIIDLGDARTFFISVLSDFRHVSSAVVRRERIHHVQLGIEPRETGQTSVVFLALLLSCCLRRACASGRSPGLEIISEAEGRPRICEH